MAAPKLNSKEVRDLPKTGMKRMIENELPPDSNLKVSSHVVTIFQHGMHGMLSLLSEEIATICAKSNKTIVTCSPQTIVEAIQNLGFDEYMKELNAFVHMQDEQNKKKKGKKGKNKRNKRNKSNTNDQELVNEQERLMREATEKLYGNISTNRNNDKAVDKQDNANCKLDNEQNDESGESSDDGFQLLLP